MAKEFTKEELQEQAKRLQEEVEKLEKIIQASDTSTFEIMIEDIKSEMLNNVAEENWKMLKQNKTKVEQFRNIVRIIQNQDELLEQKQNELEDIIWKLDHFQQSLFDQKQEVKEEPIENPEEDYVTTGYISQGATLYTGDVWKEPNPKENGEFIFYGIKKSEEIENSFAIIGNTIDGERLMQYPSNLKMLEGTHYVGNIFVEDDDQENAIKAFDIILSSTNQGDEKEEV